MRKLWPPTDNRLTIRVWAAISSAILNLVGLLCAFCFGVTNVLWWIAFPGIGAFLLLNGSIEEATSVWRISIGVALWAVLNLVFYYFVARFVISAFKPVKGWWPEKQS